MRHPLIHATLAALTLPAAAQPADDAIDFVTISDPGNIGYNRFDPDGFAAGSGSLDYEYRIGRLEVTTQQWLGFVNAMHTSGEISDQFFAVPFTWGAEIDPTYNGPGQRFRLRSDVPSAAMLPVPDINWHAAAYFCNWLHNDQPSSFAAIQTGAYDTSTWRLNQFGQLTIMDPHLPDAKYWIPTYDEWLKAVYYDPDKDGLGNGGWWEQPNGTDEPLTPGMPGEGETAAGLPFDISLYSIPLGAYPDVQTPWGLLDASGASLEWSEDYVYDHVMRWKRQMGSNAGGALIFDQAWTFNFSQPQAPFAGFRIASAIPPPSSLMAFGMWAYALRRRPQR